jgi:hypothetical protein
MIVNENLKLQHMAQYKKIATWHILEKIKIKNIYFKS